MNTCKLLQSDTSFLLRLNLPKYTCRCTIQVHTSDPVRLSSLPHYLFSCQFTCVNFCIFQIWKIFYRDYILGRLLPEDLKFLTLILLAHSSDLIVGWVTFERFFYKWLIQPWGVVSCTSQGSLSSQSPGLTSSWTLPPNLGVCLMWRLNQWTVNQSPRIIHRWWWITCRWSKKICDYYLRLAPVFVLPR